MFLNIWPWTCFSWYRNSVSLVLVLILYSSSCLMTGVISLSFLSSVEKRSAGSAKPDGQPDVQVPSWRCDRKGAEILHEDHHTPVELFFLWPRSSAAGNLDPEGQIQHTHISPQSVILLWDDIQIMQRRWFPFSSLRFGLFSWIRP